MGKPYEMFVLNPQGHEEIKWNPKNKAEVEAAQAVFDAMLKRGFRAFDDKGAITEFNPDAEEITVTPAIRAG